MGNIQLTRLWKIDEDCIDNGMFTIATQLLQDLSHECRVSPKILHVPGTEVDSLGMLDFLKSGNDRLGMLFWDWD